MPNNVMNVNMLLITRTTLATHDKTTQDQPVYRVRYIVVFTNTGMMLSIYHIAFIRMILSLGMML